jgi:hypothetical protein
VRRLGPLSPLHPGNQRIHITDGPPVLCVRVSRRLTAPHTPGCRKLPPVFPRGESATLGLAVQIGALIFGKREAFVATATTLVLVALGSVLLGFVVGLRTGGARALVSQEPDVAVFVAGVVTLYELDLQTKNNWDREAMDAIYNLLFVSGCTASSGPSTAGRLSGRLHFSGEQRSFRPPCRSCFEPRAV